MDITIYEHPDHKASEERRVDILITWRFSGNTLSRLSWLGADIRANSASGMRPWSNLCEFFNIRTEESLIDPFPQGHPYPYWYCSCLSDVDFKEDMPRIWAYYGPLFWMFFDRSSALMSHSAVLFPPPTRVTSRIGGASFQANMWFDSSGQCTLFGAEVQMFKYFTWLRLDFRTTFISVVCILYSLTLHHDSWLGSWANWYSLIGLYRLCIPSPSCEP